MTKVKLRVYYGKNAPGETVDVKADEAKHLIETRQATAVEDSTPKTEEKKPTHSRKAGGDGES